MGRKVTDVIFVIAISLVLVIAIAERLVLRGSESNVLDANFVLNIVTLVALLYLGRGYIVNAAHRQEDEARGRTLAVQASELQTLTASNLRLSKELADVRTKCTGDVAHLSGQVEQLTNENASMRQLVMLDKIPPALLEAMQHVAGDAATAITQVLEVRLNPINQQIGRLVEKQLLQEQQSKAGT